MSNWILVGYFQEVSKQSKDFLIVGALWRSSGRVWEGEHIRNYCDMRIASIERVLSLLE